MKLTKEQFEEIGPWHFNDLCFDSEDQDMMLRVFNALPRHLQGKAFSWGCSDSVFRDDVFEFLLDNQFDMTYDEYVESEIGKNFFENQVYQEIDFDKLDPSEDELVSITVPVGKHTPTAVFLPPTTSIQYWDPSKGRYKEKMQRLLDRHKPNKDA